MDNKLYKQIQELEKTVKELKIRYEYNNFSKLEVKDKDFQFNGNVGFYKTKPVAQASTIANPSGGATQDAEARSAINSILTALKNIGIIASS